ncbi:MAG TPA: outer membrane protein assembly factor BamA [Steroidobacteraceae bacterium]|nr:outer membrane protein assembly factor BamA [Steroidobacteraceae bacterium]
MRLMVLTPLLLAMAGAVRADDATFTVTGIRVEGLQRIAEGTLLNTLPVNIGDTLDARRVREALRAVHATGFFRDVQLRREEPGVLVVVVQEHPSIRSFAVSGNKDIKTEDLTKSLRSVGLASGKILNRSTLEDVRQYLTEQYFARGRYAVMVDARVEEVSGNLVDVRVDIVEGKRARIRQINVVGNGKFSDQELLGPLELSASNLLSFYRGDDKYSRQALEGDLEKIRSHYLDRGYAEFEITSTQVTVTPEKQDLFVTINVFEGDHWKTGAVKLAGRFTVAEEILRRYVVIRPGDVYSQRLIAASEQALRDRLGEAGYAFADVAAVPVANPQTHEIALTFQIEPNARSYVRRIEFQGVERTNDAVLRRELRQLEGGALSNVALQRSEERLQRLPYIEKVEYETRRVPGSEDLVDVEFNVEEGPSSQISGGIGYSERQEFMLSGNYVDSNLFGSGERFAIEFNGGQYSQVFSVAHTDPYFTSDGVSRSLNASYVERERLTSSFSQFSTQTYSAGFGTSYPLSEDQFVNFGLTYNHEDLATVVSSSTQLRDWVRDNGDDYYRRVGRDPVLGTILDTVELSAGWLYDSRNRYLFPTRGGMHRFTFTITPPGGSVEFATATWRSQQFFRFAGIPLLEKIPFSLATNLGWGRAFGDTTALPPHRHIFTGGSDSVRGFRDGTLGPRDSLGNPYGGDAGVSAQLEAILPMPGKFASSAQVSLFVDAGQSFYLGDTTFRNKRGDRVEYPFDLSELRSSTGIALQWLSPMGLFRFSYAIPLRMQHETRREYGDDFEGFQFSVGKAF